MLNYVIYTEILNRLNASADLSRALLLGNNNFAELTISYLSEFLDFSQKNQFYFTSDISAALNKILTFKPSASLTGSSRHVARQERNSCVSDALEEVLTKVKENIRDDKETFDKCINYLIQCLNTIKNSDLDLTSYSPNQQINVIDKVISSNENYITIKNQIIGIVGRVNYRLLLAIAIVKSN